MLIICSTKPNKVIKSPKICYLYRCYQIVLILGYVDSLQNLTCSLSKIRHRNERNGEQFQLTFCNCKENRINNISNMFGLQVASNLACTAVFLHHFQL